MKIKNIIEYISSAEGELGDVCTEIYLQYLKNCDDAYRNFQLFLENWFEMESTDTLEVKTYYSEEEYRDCMDEIAPVVKRILSNLVEKNDSPDKFYCNLWDSINNDIIFGSDLEKICAVLFVVLSPKIPYYQMNEALRMDDDEYSNISTAIEPWYKRAIFALNRGYKQRTEVASQILSIFKEIENEKQQVVYVANLIGYHRSRTNRLIEENKRLRAIADSLTD